MKSDCITESIYDGTAYIQIKYSQLEVFMIRLIILILFLIIYFLISLPIQLAELILEKFNMDVRNRSSLAFVNFGLRCVCFISGVKLEVNGYDNIPKDRAVLFIGNHISYYDIIVTYPLMKRPTGYIAKKEIKKIPFLSWWMYFVNCVFLDRKDPRQGLKSVLTAAEMIESGISIFLFPEGTRSKDGKLADFKDGGFKIASKSKCPIIPVGIQGTSDVFENHFPLVKSSKVTVNFGEPIFTDAMERSEIRQLPEIVKEKVKELSNQ